MAEKKRGQTWKSILRSLSNKEKTVTGLSRSLHLSKRTVIASMAQLKRKKYVKKVGKDPETKEEIYGISERGKKALQK